LNIRFDKIPIIDVSPLFGTDSEAYAPIDDAIGRACREVGFLVITGQPAAASLDYVAQECLLAFFDLPEADKLTLARHQNNPVNHNIYRGWFPALAGERSYKEGIDIGPEHLVGDPIVQAREPLLEPNQWPPEAMLPGWREAVLNYWNAMNALGFVMIRAIARHLGLPANWFDDKFENSNASLRLLKYPQPVTTAQLSGLTWVDTDSNDPSRHIVAAVHTDSGCLSLLSQDNVGGLQVENGEGTWVDVPTIEGSLVVNIGDTLARWTNDVLRATRHRVLGPPSVRHSIPYFFEPRFDTTIECVPTCAGADGPQYPSVRFGDHLLYKMSTYTEFHTLFRGGVLQRPAVGSG